MRVVQISVDFHRKLCKNVAPKGHKMKTLNIAEARSEFSALVDEVRLGGEDIVISKYGRPVAMLVAYRPKSDMKRPGRDWRDELGLRDPNFKLDPHFDDPMDDLWEVYDDNAEEPTP